MNSEVPGPSSSAARNRMVAVRRSDTTAETGICQALDNLGLIYEINARPLTDLARTADMVFRVERVAVFVDGCFWHGCPIHGTQAKANAEFWRKKIEANQRRDLDTNRKLTEHDWLVVRLWEHEAAGEAASRIAEIINARRVDE